MSYRAIAIRDIGSCGRAHNESDSVARELRRVARPQGAVLPKIPKIRAETRVCINTSRFVTSGGCYSERCTCPSDNCMRWFTTAAATTTAAAAAAAHTVMTHRRESQANRSPGLTIHTHTQFSLDIYLSIYLFIHLYPSRCTLNGDITTATVGRPHRWRLFIYFPLCPASRNIYRDVRRNNVTSEF